LEQIDIERENIVAFFFIETKSGFGAKHIPFSHEAHELRHPEYFALRVVLCILVDVIGDVEKDVQPDISIVRNVAVFARPMSEPVRRSISSIVNPYRCIN